MDDRVKRADSSLSRYYTQHNALYSGQFKKWVNENGFDSDGIEEEFEVDPEDSCLLEIDDNFPGDLDPVQIVGVLFKCWYDPDPFRDTALKVTSKHWNVDGKQKKDIIAIYRTQCPTIFPHIKNNESIIKLLAVSRNLNEPYFQLLYDMYQRDRMRSNSWLQPNEWALRNKHCMELKAMESESDKPLNEVVSAVQSINRNMMPILMLNSQTVIVDSLEETAKYIAVFVDFVSNLAEQNNEYYNLLIHGYSRCQIEKIYKMRIPNDIKCIVSMFYIDDTGYCPFQVDVCLTFNEVHDISTPALSGVDSVDDDDEDDDDDDEKFPFHDQFYDVFGDIKKRLSAEKLLHEISVIGDQQNGDNRELSDKLLMNAFEHFKNRQIAQKYNKQHVFATYPQKHRFCILIDKRKPDKLDIDSKNIIEEDEMIYFEPPNDCNTFPENDHVPFWYFNSSQTCIIPSIGYKHGQNEKNWTKRELNETITSRTPCKGALLTMSFHVESVKETRVYLYLNGQTARFLPEDIITVLPRFFDKTYGNNKDFPQSEKAQTLVDRMMTKLKDDKFDAFYQIYQYKP